MTNVLCVCLGNTCRSPMMERMLRHTLDGLVGFSHVTVESAGLLESAAGQPMAEFSQKELRERGIDADGHASRFIGTLDLRKYHLILTVGEDEANAISELREGHAPILILGGGVPNPWKQGEQAYHDCANNVEQSLSGIIDLLDTWRMNTVDSYKHRG